MLIPNIFILIFFKFSKIDRRYVGGLKSTYVQNYNKEFTENEL